MLLYRISKSKRARDLTGEGARLYGGRWNLKGTSVIYSADSTALATLETLVHSPRHLMPKNRSIVTLELPDKLKITQLDFAQLPQRWWVDPAPIDLAAIGSKWARNCETVAFAVPSAVTPNGEGRNYILNPRHRDFSQIEILTISKYDYDQRLFMQSEL